MVAFDKLVSEIPKFYLIKYRVSQKMTNRKNPNKRVLGVAKFSQEHDLGALDPA